MKIKKLFSAGALAALAMFAITAQANSIDANAARAAAKNFVNSKATKTFKGRAATADIKLAYTEKSDVSGNAYYVFNVEGGGWVIIAGDDHAKQVLAYGDKGNIDMNDMPSNMKSQLYTYKLQIEQIQNYKGKLVAGKAHKNVNVVEPLTKSTWGQNEPMDRFTPTSGSSHYAVGCAPLAMAQIMYYWKYPQESAGMSSYYVYGGCGTVPALEATTFDYTQMLDAYTIFNPETNGVSLGTYTTEQAEAVATLCRYAGHACKARYGNSGTSTGAYSYDQRDAFKFFGYKNDIQLVGFSPSYYCDNSNKFTEDEWKALISVELEAGRPIAYHNVDYVDGHAWVLDGVDADGKFHMNWGFYERFNGWFEFGAFGFYPYGDSEYWDFSCSNNTCNEMIIGLYPYDGYVIPGATTTPMPTIFYQLGDGTITFSAEGNGDVHMYIDGQEVTSPYTMNLGATEMTVVVSATAQEEGMEISETAENTFLLPVATYIRGDVNNDGNVSISDVTALINYLLTNPEAIIIRNDVNLNGKVNISDVTALINYLLSKQW